MDLKSELVDARASQAVLEDELRTLHLQLEAAQLLQLHASQPEQKSSGGDIDAIRKKLVWALSRKFFPKSKRLASLKAKVRDICDRQMGCSYKKI